MRDEQLEECLREGRPGDPPAGLREAIIRRARQRQAGQTRRRWVRWALSAAAGLLMATNLAFGRLHEQRLDNLMGGPAVTHNVTLVDLTARRAEMSLLLTVDFNRERGSRYE